MKPYLFLLLSVLSFTGNAQVTALQADSLKQQAVADTTGKNRQEDSLKTATAPPSWPDTSGAAPAVSTKKQGPGYQPQIKLLLDVGNLGLNFLDERRNDYEISADYLYRNNWYIVAEGGYAEGKIDYDNLKYRTTSSYLRVGGDKSLLEPISKRDLDIVFFGFRYGIGMGTRGDAYYVVPSQFGPSKEGVFESQDFIVHWGEMTAGMRVELWQGIYAGWNFRARFLLNGKVFEQKISPNYIAGYGVADKSTSFGFNIYLGYAFRWHKKSPAGHPQ